MKRLDTKVVKERSQRMAAVAAEVDLRGNEAWVGWRGWVLVDEVEKKGLQGRNYAYRPVAIRGKGARLGAKLEVEVVGASVAGLVGRVLTPTSRV
jgi:tRNA A37 methylthiotransferase MiaB